MRLLSLAVIVIIAAVSPLPAENIQHGLRVPPGFEVTEFADSKLANDIFSMTLDPHGRIVGVATSASWSMTITTAGPTGPSILPTAPKTGPRACSGRAPRFISRVTAACAATGMKTAMAKRMVPPS
jgi:hypothetical protein